MKYITTFKMNGEVIVREFTSEKAQEQHTGWLWDMELMDQIEWIDYDIA